MRDKISIGSMRLRFVIQQEVAESDNGGGVETLWQDIDGNSGIFAQNLAFKTEEKMRFAQIGKAVTHKIAARAHPQLKPGNGLKDEEERLYRIESVEHSSGHAGYVVCFLKRED